MRNKPIFNQLCHALRGRFYSQTLQKDMALRKANYNALEGHTPEIIFLGGSHARFAFYPDAFDAYSFNAGELSADCFIMYHLGKKLLEEYPSIKKVVLMLSFYNGGFDLSKTGDYNLTALYNKFLGIPWRPLFFPCKFAAALINTHKYLPKCGDPKGWEGEKPFFPPDFPVGKRVAGHIKQATKYGSAQWQYVEKLRNLCSTTGRDLILCSSPLRSDYRQEMHRQFELHNLNPWREISNVNTYRFIDTEDWIPDEGFGDMDHLNLSGAVQFSKKLNQLLK